MAGAGRARSPMWVEATPLAGASPGTQPQQHQLRSTANPFGPLLVIAGSAYLVAPIWALMNASYDVSGGLVLLPILLGITIPLVTRAARREGDTRLVRILTLAVVVKLVVGTLVRYGLLDSFYGGSPDAVVHHSVGQAIAASFRAGDFSVDLGAGSEGTQALRLITGIVYTVIGSTRLGGFLVFSWLAFLGLFFFFRAFRVTFPNGDYHRYAMLLFFLPTLIFWPSSIGKESWLVFGLGLSAYGAARLFAQRHGGFVLVGVGIAAITIVRPHMGMMVFLALVFGYALRRARRDGAVLSASKVVGLAVLVIVAALVAGRFADEFGIDELNPDSVTGVLDETTRRTTQGGAEYQPIDAVGNPGLIPLAVVTVTLRPFPFEAHNTQALVTSIEAGLLAALMARSWRRVAEALRASPRTAYLAFAIVYILSFCVAFGSVGNFGILARQRAQLYPVLLVLLCVPLAERMRSPLQPSVRWARDGSASI